jgi:hypothetical protein
MIPPINRGTKESQEIDSLAHKVPQSMIPHINRGTKESQEIDSLAHKVP